MALLNLGEVTRALKRLLEWNIPRIDPTMPAFTVSAEAPESVSSASGSVLTVHLYHAAEDPSFKNLPGPGNDPPNVAKAAMALNLYYVVTARHVSDNFAQDPLDAQRIFGLALKTFHDFPVITEQTRLVDPATATEEFVLPDAIRSRDNRLQIIYRPITPEEALAYWTTDDQRTARLSAYYEVRVVLLQPEPAKRIPGAVLGIGAFVVEMAGPLLERSESAVHFTLPASAGGEERAVNASPARVPLVVTPAHNRLVLRGANLTGRSQTVVLRSALWPRMTPPLPERVTIDPSWTITFAPDRVDVDVQSQIVQGTDVFDLLPGFYTAAVRVVRDELHLLGQLKQIVSTTNEVPFAITPWIDGHGPPDVAQRRVRLALAPTFDVQRVELDGRVQVVVDGEVYTELDPLPAGPAGDRAFVRSGPSELTLQTPFPLSIAGAHATRVIVDGAESQPFWIEV